MAITRFDPMHEMRTLARRMERAFEPLINTMEPYGLDVAEREEIYPRVDVYEDVNEIIIRADLPGLERKNVELIVEEGTLTLRGERHLEREDKRENYRRVECWYGNFARTFSLPPTIDREKVRAEMREGVLYVHVPKREGAKPRTITITG
ncbi:MAG TPA: Hsp20/alpha crystallin family protein [Myxococcales bacterium]|jgi:HSP20 family protein